MKVNGRDVRAVWWEGGAIDGRVMMVDQRGLPFTLRSVGASNVRGVAECIRNMTVRGAPTIGATAAYGMVLGADDPGEAASVLRAARPTARDLFDAVEWMLSDTPTVARAEAYVRRILDRCRAIGRHGAERLATHAHDDGTVRVLTHCHAGAFATVDIGSALAPFHHWTAHRQDTLEPFVWVGETRPRVQGAITSWELGHLGVDHRVIVDNAAGALMARGEVDCVIVGADRVAANGDVANKIGTYTKAVLAARHGIPFYVAFPASTFDPGTADGAAIPIEERDADEVLSWRGEPLYARGTRALNPAFDVTPAALVTGYVTEHGVLDAAGLRVLAGETEESASSSSASIAPPSS